jgi:hypothetical protein
METGTLGTIISLGGVWIASLPDRTTHTLVADQPALTRLGSYFFDLVVALWFATEQDND